ncbi:MAG: hypothetical protein IJ853_02405 [Rickettsiales bacterium]|nr:hypothetical protein [Rickettsiales bacterium]
MKTVLKYVILSALRDKLFLGLSLAILAIFGISNLMGFTATSEETLMQTALFAGSFRTMLVCGMVVFICFHINKSFENREISFMLSKNISREKFILSYWIAFSIISFLLILMFSVMLLLFCRYNLLGSIQWMASVMFETMMIIMFSILASFILESAIFSVFSTIGFYIIARLMGFFINMHLVRSGSVIYNIISTSSHFLSQIVSSIIPRLDLFSQTKWIIYGADFSIFKVVFAQSIIYIAIMFMMAFYDFKNKQF